MALPAEILKELKVAVVGPLPPPAGGMANQAQQLVQLLEQAGVQVEFVRMNAPYAPRCVEGIKGLRAVFRLMAYFYNLCYKIRKVDVVHVLANSGWSWYLFAAPAVWVAWLIKKPVVINYRGGEARAFFKKSWHWIAPTINKSQSVIVPSAYLQRVFENQRVASVIVPNILDLQRFDFEDKKERENDSPHLVVTRNLEKIYGVDTVLRAFVLIKAQYSDARLTVAGSGPEEAELKALAASLGLQESVTFSGRLEPEQIAQLYQEADVLLNASTVDNSPNSLIEALASGVPVVSSNVGGIPDLVMHRQSALLVSPKQPEAMADAALEVLADDMLKKQLVEQGKTVAARFDKHTVLDKLASVYQGVMS